MTGPPVRALTTPAPIALTAATMAPTVSAVPKRSPIWAQPNQKNAAPAKIAPLIAQSLGRSPSA